jgi:FkbM family methyltransferase
MLVDLKGSVGLVAAMRWEALRFAVKLGYPEPDVWSVRPHQALHPLQIRLRGSSDIAVFHQIFICQEYSCLRELKEPSLVLDLGANVGFSAAYFLSAFPTTRVVVVEPDERNLEMCKVNLAPYGDRVMFLHGAVWSRPTILRLSKGTFGDGLEWATQVTESIEEDGTSAGVQAWDVGSLIEISGGATVDLLKVDIEGAELTVFGASVGSWLHKVRNICIELHGKDCEEVFFDALQDFDYDLEYSDELTICRNLRPKESANSRAVFRAKSIP